MENNTNQTNRKTSNNHSWTIDEEQFLLATTEYSAIELKAVFFNDLSVAAINLKLRRLLDEGRFNKVGPWSETELRFLRGNLNLRNAEVQKTILRTADDINNMRWSIKHGKSTNRIGPHRRYRFAYNPNYIQPRYSISHFGRPCTTERPF
jgi:hypothetical protein